MIIDCKVSKIESAKNNIYKVYISPVQNIDFKAGQYIFIKLNDKKTPFSIANCPTENKVIELHIGSSNQDSSSTSIEYFVDAFVNNSKFKIDAPHGEAWLRTNNYKPILLIAGGTGLSYINSILKNCLNRGFIQPIYLYWGVKNIDFLYADEELTQLSNKHCNLVYIPVIIEDEKAVWLGKKGTVIDAVMEDFIDLTPFDIYVCGPYQMTKAAKERLVSEKKQTLSRCMPMPLLI
ncbi:NAD(P)H-flavin reductase [Shewanella woodyi]|uniref:flavin mononucleotide reductase LuxG n=1 Tax=Shewanella woodyi TaxID=60961 RepID=UPI0037489E00